MTKTETVTRRDFLRGTICGAAVFALELPGVQRTWGRAVEGPARVVLVRDEEALDRQGKCNGPVVSKMLDDAVSALLDVEHPDEAWKTLLSKDDVLGIKTNFWPRLPTPRALEEAIRLRALEVGIPETEISGDDRGVLDNPVFRRATALVNVRPLRTHHWAGIGGCLKNYIMFSRTPSDWHEDSCADLGGLWRLPICRGKTRLNVLVVLTPLFHGIGPHHFDARHVWEYKGLLVSSDPVAVDALGVKLLEEKRRRFFERLPRGGTSTKHVRLADTRHGIGVADLKRIELIRIGWMEEALI